MAYAPPVTLHNYTNTHATHSNVPWSWTGLVPQCLVGLFASPRRCRWAAWAGWVGSSCPPPLRGWGRTAPPLRGGSLPSACSLTSPRLSCACVDVRSGASVCGRLGMCDRVVPEYRILSRNLEFDPFSKSHSWAGYVCFVLLRECIPVSVTYGDSCD